MSENNFYSIDRLVEFGLGIAVAQQMVRTMNEAATSAYAPGVMQPITRSSMPGFFAAIDGVQSGPFSEAELQQLIKDKRIHKETYVWRPGMSAWDLALNQPEFMRLVALTPPPLPNLG